MSEWRPIKTAPKRTLVLAYWADEEVMQIAQWSGFRGQGQWEDSSGEDIENPSHWMPLPDPPEKAQGTK